MSVACYTSTGVLQNNDIRLFLRIILPPFEKKMKKDVEGFDVSEMRFHRSRRSGGLISRRTLWAARDGRGG